MDITLSIKITEEGIPQLMGLLAKMWDQPNPISTITVEKTEEGKTVTLHRENPQPAPAAETQPVQAQPVTPPQAMKPVTAAQVQAAAGAFMDASPNNLTILQGMLAELGVQAVPFLTPEQVQIFAAKLREHGVTV